MKHNYILLHFIKFFYRASPVAASGHLHYFLSLLFFTFSIFPFRSSHQKCSIKKAVLIILNILRKTSRLGYLLIRFIPATSLTRDSNTGVFLLIFLFTNSYRITCFSFCIDIFSKKDYKRKNVTPIKRARTSS